MTDKFCGFDDDFWAFFAELKNNNDREWFARNKSRYQEKVVAPIGAFIAAVAPKLKEISPHYNADPRPNRGSMFRIYRDVRFSKDKKPYKEHAAVQFRHHMGRDVHAPGFYVHLESGNVVYGGGVWLPPGAALLKIRERIVAKPEEWQAILDDPQIKKQFGHIQGDSLKRPPRGFDANAPHMDDLKRKSFFAMKKAGKAKDVTTPEFEPEFVDEVINTFEAATPLMVFISSAVGAQF